MRVLQTGTPRFCSKLENKKTNNKKHLNDFSFAFSAASLNIHSNRARKMLKLILLQLFFIDALS